MNALSLRVVALWGKSQKRRRHSLARSIAALLRRRGESALTKDGSFEAAMLLFKRCSASIKKEQLKLNMLALEDTRVAESSSVRSHQVDAMSLVDILTVMEALVRLPESGSLLAAEFVSTNEIVHSLFKVSPKVAVLASRIFSMVYERTSFLDVFKGPSQLHSFARSIETVPEGPHTKTAVEACIEMLIDQGNPKGIGTRAASATGTESASQITILAEAAKIAFRKLLFHHSSRIRTSAAVVLVKIGRNLPQEQRPTNSRIIKAGIQILGSNIFDTNCIGAGFGLLSWVLSEHKKGDVGMNGGEESSGTSTLSNAEEIEVMQIRDGLVGLLNNAPVPQGKSLFDTREYEEEVLTSAQSAALRLLFEVAMMPRYGHLLDHKVVLRGVLGSLTNRAQFGVQVEALRLLRCFLSKDEALKASRFRGKRNWKKALKTATSTVETGDGNKIISEDAAIRAFLTNDLDAETVESLQVALRKLGWLKDELQSPQLVDRTTSSLIVSNKLRGKLAARRKQKELARLGNTLASDVAKTLGQKKKTQTAASKSVKENSPGSEGAGRYHDEGIIHVPYEMKHGAKRLVNATGRLGNRMASPRAMTATHTRSDKGRITGSKSLASRLKAKSFLLGSKNKTKSGIAAALSAVAAQSGNDWNFATLLTANAMPPPALASHVRYRPMGFASFLGQENGRDSGKNLDLNEGAAPHSAERRLKDSSSSSTHNQQVGGIEGGSNQEVASKAVSDKHSFLQCCNNRDYVSFQSKMAEGAHRVMSIEADDADRVAEDLLHQIDIDEARKIGDSNKIAARLGHGVAGRAREKETKMYQKGTAEHRAHRIDKAMELLAARNQRHKRLVRVQVVTTDRNNLTTAGMVKKRNGWHEVGGQLRVNPIAKAMLHGWCCGYNLEEQPQK
eukprot:g2572.t1